MDFIGEIWALIYQQLHAVHSLINRARESATLEKFQMCKKGYSNPKEHDTRKMDNQKWKVIFLEDSENRLSLIHCTSGYVVVNQKESLYWIIASKRQMGHTFCFSSQQRGCSNGKGPQSFVITDWNFCRTCIIERERIAAIFWASRRLVANRISAESV